MNRKENKKKKNFFFLLLNRMPTNSTEYRLSYYERNKERLQKQAREYHWKHKHKINEYSRQYWIQNKDRLNEQRKNHRYNVMATPAKTRVEEPVEPKKVEPVVQIQEESAPLPVWIPKPEDFIVKFE
jgi:hypothetical protein